MIADPVAELRERCPGITACTSRLEHWQEGGRTRYSLRLDIRGCERQTLVSGPAADSAQGAAEAACRQARELLLGRKDPGL